jgi:hypothetical protein
MYRQGRTEKSNPDVANATPTVVSPISSLLDGNAVGLESFFISRRDRWRLAGPLAVEAMATNAFESAEPARLRMTCGV